MAARVSQSRSISQRIANRGRERGLSRADAFTAYTMDRLLHRLGRSDQASEFYLKGGVLVSNLFDTPFRFTRDIDLLRRHGPADPDDLRARFERIVALEVDDGLQFERVVATRAERLVDGYDGVKVKVHARIARRPVEVQVDVGFGDATVPDPARLDLDPFLDGQEAARVVAYDIYTVLAEKLETVLTRFPAIQHRLKDIIDVAIVADRAKLDAAILRSAFAATIARRGSRIDHSVVAEMVEAMTGRTWERDWATMQKEKAVSVPTPLRDAVGQFVDIARVALDDDR